MSNHRPTQCIKVIEYIKRHGSITSWEAIRDLGCMRLASRISELKRKGYPIYKTMITGKTRDGERASWARYSLLEVQNAD